MIHQYSMCMFCTQHLTHSKSRNTLQQRKYYQNTLIHAKTFVCIHSTHKSRMTYINTDYCTVQCILTVHFYTALWFVSLHYHINIPNIYQKVTLNIHYITTMYFDKYTRNEETITFTVCITDCVILFWWEESYVQWWCSVYQRTQWFLYLFSEWWVWKSINKSTRTAQHDMITQHHTRVPYPI